MSPIFYLDYENGADVNDGSDWANAWKTITSGATAARIAPGDVIRIAKSPAPVAVAGGDHTAAWTDASKTVTLNAAETLEIDDCEDAWTAAVGGDATCSANADEKEGTYSSKILMDAAPQASTLQAYFATGTLNLSGYQKITFWIKNSAAIADNDTWIITLCSDNAGATPVDTFVIPAIASVNMYLPLTIARTGGGNLGAAIESIAISTGGTAPANNSYVYLDNFTACTTAGLNLQSLISKNSLEQGGTEHWYGIQSIVGAVVLLDNDTNTAANAGRGYSGTTETVATYKRETIKTALGTSTSTKVQEVMDTGTYGSNIEFQGGYNTGDSNQDGETFFDGLNGLGWGLYAENKDYITLNYLNFYRYDDGVSWVAIENWTVTNISSGNNSNNGIFLSNCHNSTFITIRGMCNNGDEGLYLSGSYNNTFHLISHLDNNEDDGLYLNGAHWNTFHAISSCKNNVGYGVYFTASYNNTIGSLVTANNTTAGVYNNIGINYLRNVLIAEGSEVPEASFFDFTNARVYSWQHDQTADNHWMFTDSGSIHSQATTRHTASGVAWQFTPLANRHGGYPLDEVIGEFAVNAGAQVTVTCWCKKDHATNIAAALVCRGGQLAGVAADVTDTKADDTDWEELSIVFTPTEAGVIKVELWAWYVTGNSDVYLDDVTRTQA